ncbi:MAG: 3-hydroxybutyryl-CoA dehydrogenase [Crocinitomix sp.]|nr:3-hydroxybutyryl-CoA dehydrogenase [Crocinitomix sp.]
MKIGIVGAGSMGSGIAKVAAQCEHEVVLFDTNRVQLDKAESNLAKLMASMVEKGKISQETSTKTQGLIHYSSKMEDFGGCGLVIEAIIENLAVKKSVFEQLEGLVDESCLLASNTSSLSIASIAASCKKADRVLGIHFFNPAPLMPLVEIIPAVQTSLETVSRARTLIDSWKKVTVLTKDTPGFIVNRVARPFYGEALKIYEEGLADFATIDWAMTSLGGFKMGPFTLMDYIGNDINYTVTETVFTSFYFDPRYRPSFTQKRHSEAGWFGRKSGRGYYDYSEGAILPTPDQNEELGAMILRRILVMLINEAVDAVFLNIATAQEVDLAMTKGVNYPKGLLQWANELGLDIVLKELDELYHTYGDDRYRASVLLRKMVKNNQQFSL